MSDLEPARRPVAIPSRYELADSPLRAGAERHSLWGRIVTDAGELAVIRARIERSRRPRLLVDLLIRLRSVLFSTALVVVVLAVGGVLGWWSL